MPRKSSQPDPESLDVKTHRVNTNIPEPIFEVLRGWADSEERSPGNLASLLLELIIREEAEKGTYPIQRLIELRRQRNEGKENADVADLSITYVKAIGQGLPMNVLDIQHLANRLGVPSDRLAHFINHKGETHHAKNSH